MTSRPRETVGPIVLLVQAIRPEWDTRGVRPVLEQLLAEGRDIADIAFAAVRTAQDPSLRTPATIGWTHTEHWRPTIRSIETPAERAARVDAQIQRNGDLMAERQQPRTFTDRHLAARAAARAAARDARARTRLAPEGEPA